MPSPTCPDRNRLARDAGRSRLRPGFAGLLCCWLVAVSYGPTLGVTLPSRFHPDRILMMPREVAHSRALAQEQADCGRPVLRAFPGVGGLLVVRVAEGETVAQALAACQESDLVAWAEPDYVVTAAAVLPNDPYFQNGTQWALNNYGQNSGIPDADLDAPEAWEVLRSASNMVVAIVDSGVRPTHEDLAENLWRNPADGTPGFNAFTGQHDPWDDNGHGTHVAGIIGAVGNNARGIAGVAWRTQLMVCKFLDAAGNGYNSDAVACIEFARTNGAHILNLSWGGSELSAAVSNALWAARADGMLVAAAAGNNAANVDVFPYYPACLALDHIVAVGASTRADERWSGSSYGATGVDVFAPGADIYSTARTGDGAYQSRNGTSMATACVAGALALLRQQLPDSPIVTLRTRLLAAVDVKPAFVGRCASGGRLNLRKALDQPAIALNWSNQMAHVQVTGVPGHTYMITATTNWSIWTAVQTNQTSLEGHWLFADPTSPTLPMRFYRAHPGP